MEKLIIKTDDVRLKVLDNIRTNWPDRLFIWGNGSYSRDINDYLRTVGHYDGHIRFLVDDSYYHPGQENAIPISEFLRRGGICEPVVFGFYNYSQILKKKSESQISNLYDFHLTIVNGKRLQWDPFQAKEREEDYLKTYERLSDEKSKRVMQLYLNAATAGEFHELFIGCYEPRGYFNYLTEDLQVDTLIDCGAFNGDSIHDFVSVFPNYKKIIAIEPDASNLEMLLEREKKENIRNLMVISKGVGSTSGVLHFRAAGESNSYIDESGDSEIQITTLDEIRFNAAGKILLKMDIEGSELEALHGAEKLIRENHPILTICVYHKLPV